MPIDFQDPKEIKKELEKVLKENFGAKINLLTSEQYAKKHRFHSDREKSSERKHSDRNSKLDILSFSKTPKEVKQHLDRFVIGQDESKKTLSIAICNHYNQLKHYHSLSKKQKINYEYSKQNVLIIGPTGVGKTYLVKQIAKLINVPFVRADATKYSETGYIGANVEDLIKDLVQQADGDLTRAEHGIVYIDEVDKLAGNTSLTSHGSKDISGRGVQLGLLKMLEECEIDLRHGSDPASQMQALIEMQTSNSKTLPSKKVNTRHILFIMSGAFTHLEEIISKRIATKTIGFINKEDKDKDSKPPSTYEIISQVKTEDLQKFGFEPEFIGRLPVRVCCHKLSVNDLYHILKNSHGSVIKQYILSFDAYNIAINFNDNALKEIAKLAFNEHTGARSLVTIIDNILRDYLFELASLNIKKLTIDDKLIKNPAKVLNQLLASQKLISSPAAKELTRFQQYYFKQNQIKIKISLSCIEFIMSKTNNDNEQIFDYLKNLLDPYAHAIKLLCQYQKKDKVTIYKKCLKDPKQYFETKIKQSFSSKQLLSNASKILSNDNL